MYDLDPDSAKAKLEINARGYHYDADLDRLADLLEQGPSAWKDMPPHILGVATVHKDFRDQYRVAVKAGAIPDDRTPDPTKEN